LRLCFQMKRSALFTIVLIAWLWARGQTAIVHNAHTITFSKEKLATVVDPVTQETKQTTSPARPVALNGEPVYTTQDLSAAPTMRDSNGANIKLCAFIFRSLKSTLEALQDGYYVPDITHAIVDSSGTLIYWQFTGLKEIHLARGAAKYNYSDLPLADSGIPTDIQQKLREETIAVLQHFPQTMPGTIRNRSVHTTGYFFSKGNYIEVKDHKATLHEDYWSL